MTDNFSRVFFDTAPLIYLVEKHDFFYEKCKKLLASFIRNKTDIYTSTITITEFGTVPYREKRENVISDFEKLLKFAKFNIENVTYSIAEIGYKLRAKYQFLRTPDALQLATAIYNNCNKFITNDKKLKQITEIEIVLIAD